MSEEKIFGEGKDGKRFDAESEEVKAYLEKHPDVNLDVAIGSVVMEHDKGLEAEGEEVPAEADALVEEPAEEVAEAEEEVPAEAEEEPKE